MNTTELLSIFRSGNTLTTEELEKLYHHLKSIADACIGQGDYFKMTFEFAIRNADRVAECLSARGVNVFE